MSKLIRIVAAVLVCSPLSFASRAAAQDPSHWGVAVSLTPTWRVPDQLKKVFDADTVDLESSDIAIGLARGRRLGGDWSVSYVHKSIKDGSSIASIESDCSTFVNGCFLNGESYTTQNVKLNGVLALKFIPFATIHRLVQIGLTAGGGVGTLSGTLDHRQVFADFRTDALGRPLGTQQESHETLDAKELFPLSVVPLGVVEISGGVTLAPGLKIRAAGGLDFPGTSRFTLTAVYLIGSH